MISAIDYAKYKKSKVFGIIGRQEGYTNIKGNVVIVVPEVDKKLITPQTEGFQAVIWHCLVSHPLLQTNKTKW